MILVNKKDVKIHYTYYHIELYISLSLFEMKFEQIHQLNGERGFRYNKAISLDLLICALYAFFIKLLKTLSPLIGATDILQIEIKKSTR